MGTISDKLVYLDGTREKIKENLNKFGSNITENDTFRSYSNVINDIYDKLPKVSANGSDFNLENAQNGKLDSFGMDGNTEQTTYSGKNLFDYTDILEVGTGASSDNDGWITITGDNSSGSSNKDINYFTNKSTKIVSNTTYAIVLEVKSITGSGTLNLVSLGGGNSQFTTLIGTNFSNLSSNTIYVYTDVTKSDVTSGNSFLRTFVRFSAGQSGSIQFRISVIEDTTITPSTFNYEPFVGGSPSPSPDYPQEVKVVNGNNTINIHGKNLFNKSTITSGKRIDPVGLPYTDENYSLSDYIKVQPNKIYTRNLTASVYQCIAYYTKDKLFINRNTSDATITTPNNAYYVRFSMENANVDTTQLELGLTPTEYEPYQSQDYEINLHGKNLLDKELSVNGSIPNNSTTEELNSDNRAITSAWIPCKPNTTYTLSGETNRRRWQTKSTNGTISYFDNTYTITTNSTDIYLRVYYWFENETIQPNAKVAMIEEGSTATEYEPYYNYELCKKDTYKDAIFKNNQLSSYYDSNLDEDSWYIKKEIGKVVLDGTLSQYIYTNNCYQTTIKYPSDIGNREVGAYCDYFKFAYYSSSLTSNMKNGEFAWNGTFYLTLKNTDFTSAAEYNNWFAQTKPTIYYPLATPTYETITNETLISQLESIETFTGLNNFSVSNENNVLPTLYVSRLKELGKLS